MPIYESVCLHCGTSHEYISSVAQCYDTPACCGQKTEKRILTPSAGMVDIPAYESPASGKWITSRSERREDMKRTGCREWEGMESERRAADREKKRTEAQQDQALDATVRKAWAQLPPEKKKQALAAS